MRIEIRRSYYAASAATFAQAPARAILGDLVSHHRFEVDLNQRDAWMAEIEDLKALALAIPDIHLFLEFAIPRMGKRADVIFVARGMVFVLVIGPHRVVRLEC